MEDIGRRILANLVGEGTGQVLHLKHPSILVARQILPSDMATLDNEQILAIVTEVGEKNAHAIIMAKSMGIPAIVAVRGALKNIAPEDSLIVDANTGELCTTNGREGVSKGAAGIASFPWMPKQFWEVMTGTVINNNPPNVTIALKSGGFGQFRIRDDTHTNHAQIGLE